MGLLTIDVEKNELISMRVYPTRNSLTAESFIKDSGQNELEEGYLI